VVPFTRGRERSRDPESVVAEARNLFEQGYREVTLLGQNVDSYLWSNGKAKKELSDEEKNNGFTFADLLVEVAKISPDLRIRFSTSNPQDMTDDVLYAIAKYENICRYIHLPVQSGSTTVLERMNRGYTREKYLERISSIKRIIPHCGISTDIITGFCGETEDEFFDTVSIMEEVKYDFAYMFKYSEREGTYAQKKFKDDVPDEVKTRRVQQVIELQQKHSLERTRQGTGKIHRVLVEGVSKKSSDMLYGRNSQNTVVVFPKENFKKGEYVNVIAEDCTATTLIGRTI
jgi:tRNA-2-methylthio-N6-dimethylallyladenosine synthase